MLTFLLVTFLFASCSTLKIKFSSTQPEKVDNIALFSTYLGIQLPVLPLLDAAVMNDKTNSISVEINDLMKENVDIIRQNIAKALEDGLRCKVIYGDALHTMPGFSELKGSYNFEAALETGKEKFPYFFISGGDFNAFNFKWPKSAQYFQDPVNYKATISALCQKLKVDYIVVSQSIIMPVPGSILIPASLYLFTNLYLFDKTGNMLVSARNNNKEPVRFKANDVEGYNQILDIHPSVVNPIIDKIAQKYGN